MKWLLAFGIFTIAILSAQVSISAENQAEIGVAPEPPTMVEGVHNSWRIKTPSGELFVGRPTPCVDDFCQQVARTDKATYEHEDYISPIRIIPNLAAPKFVALSVTCGGSACAESLTILDVGGTQILSVPNLSIYAQTAKFFQGPADSLDIVGTAFGEESKYGDKIVAKVRYNPATKLAYRVRIDGPDLIHLAGQHPEKMFLDKDLRPRLIDLLGDDTKEVRYRFQVASGIELEKGRYLVARGIQAHSGGSDEAQAIIDLASSGLWITTVADGKDFRLFRTQMVEDSEPDVSRLINEWLKNWGRKL